MKNKFGKSVWLAAVLAVSLGAAAPCEAWAEEDRQAAEPTDGPAVYTDAAGQVIEGALAKGISVSKYQNRASEAAGGIDWNKVKADGVSFAMIRMGYLEDLDPYFHQNMADARDAGIKTGVYLYTQALDQETVAAEVRFMLEQVKDYPVSYPVAWDLESDYIVQQGLTRQQITELAKAFCDGVAAAGYRPMIYTNQNWLNLYLDVEQLTDSEGQPYDIWYARYGTINSCPHRTIWQCTDSAQVDGIAGNVNLEYAFVDYDALIPGYGWKQAAGTWYYMDNYRFVTGWLREGDTFYYLGSDGKMLCSTGRLIDNCYYVFGESGALIWQEGWNLVGGIWYYVENGRLKTGWLLDGDVYYYLNADGSMVCDTVLAIDGVEYSFGSSGAWLAD